MISETESPVLTFSRMSLLVLEALRRLLPRLRVAFWHHEIVAIRRAKSVVAIRRIANSSLFCFGTNHNGKFCQVKQFFIRKRLSCGSPGTAPDLRRLHHSTPGSGNRQELVVVLTGVNYEALWPENIPEIQLSKNFVKFQNLIRSRAQKINREQGRESYTTELKQEAGDLIDAWQDAKNDVSRSIAAVFGTQSLIIVLDFQVMRSRL